jgi:hypothetical protein
MLCYTHQLAQVVAQGRPPHHDPPYRLTGGAPTAALILPGREFQQLFLFAPACRELERSSDTSTGRNLMFKTTLAVGIISAGVLGLAGCDVKKTQEGSVTVPKYEVTKKQDGDVTLPKYDVTTPDVKVGSKEETVKVPKVTTQEKKIDVPTVDVTTAKEKEKAKSGG